MSDFFPCPRRDFNITMVAMSCCGRLLKMRLHRAFPMFSGGLEVWRWASCYQPVLYRDLREYLDEKHLPCSWRLMISVPRTSSCVGGWVAQRPPYPSTIDDQMGRHLRGQSAFILFCDEMRHPNMASRTTSKIASQRKFSRLTVIGTRRSRGCQPGGRCLPEG